MLYVISDFDNIVLDEQEILEMGKHGSVLDMRKHGKTWEDRGKFGTRRGLLRRELIRAVWNVLKSEYPWPVGIKTRNKEQGSGIGKEEGKGRRNGSQRVRLLTPGKGLCWKIEEASRSLGRAS
jgi:hypothetical protein